MGVFTDKLLILNKSNSNATGVKVNVNENYWYWKDNNIVKGFKFDKQFSMKRVEKHYSERCCENMEINWELYRYIFQNNMTTQSWI